MSGHARSMSGNHDLLPANKKQNAASVPLVPLHDLSAWTFGSGTVVWKVWPAIVMHTAFAAAVVAVSRWTKIDLGIPNILITLLGVVIGFVISLRVSSAYDRYWWGRCAWSDVIKTTRTISRLIWINTPPRITKADGASGSTASSSEIAQAMREKKIALELLEGFAISLKHHLRGELGIYYEDLYPVVRPLHEHHAHQDHVLHSTKTHPGPQRDSNGQTPQQPSIENYAQQEHHQTTANSNDAYASIKSNRTPTAAISSQSQPSTTMADPVISVIHEYGSFTPSGATTAGPTHKSSYASLAASDVSDLSGDGDREPLLPSSLPGPRTGASFELVPFTSVISNLWYYLNIRRWMRRWKASRHEGFEGGNLWEETHDRQGPGGSGNNAARRDGIIRHSRNTRQTHRHAGKHRPRVAGDGENLPLELLRCLSEWLSVLEGRDTVGGNVLSGMFSCISSFEDSLTTLERILTTPLPFIYSVHIRHTIWIYLFFLPFQLVDTFDWYTIPGTAVAAFFYLGFVAAGEEIEQPFGYYENDLDLDLFCRDLIQADLRALQSTPFPNAPMGSHHVVSEIYETATVVEISKRKHRA